MLYCVAVDGIWNQWGKWGECTVTCGGGIRLRQRTCDGPYFNGTDCIGSENDTEICETDLCPSKTMRLRVYTKILFSNTHS